jgi:hypothetical protein
MEGGNVKRGGTLTEVMEPRKGQKGRERDREERREVQTALTEVMKTRKGRRE